MERREREVSQIREQVAKLERQEAEAEEALLGAQLAEFCRPGRPKVEWDRLLPYERDEVTDRLHETVGRIRFEHDRNHRMQKCSCNEEIEALRVAAAALAGIRDS